MSTEERQRVRPVYATRAVVDQARRLGLGVIEERIVEAILAGKKTRRTPAGIPPLVEGEHVVFVNDTTAVKLIRTQSPISPDRTVSTAVKLWRRRSTVPEVWA